MNFNNDLGDMQTMQEKREPLKGGWKASIYLVGVEVAERFAIFGVSGNLITYLTEVVHESTASAAKNVNIWIGVSSLLPLLGGFVADTYLGRRKTILFASLIYMMGLVLVMLSVSLVPLRFQHVLVLLSLYLVAVGQGGHKPCVQTFGADQFDENNPEEKKAKSSFFNWWYFGISAGASAAILVVYYVQDNVGWLIGFALPAMAMALSLAIFLLGWKSYRQQVCHGSPLTQVAQVFTAAYRKRHVHYIEDGYVEIHEEGHQQPLTCSNQFKFLNKATIIDAIDELSETRNGWRLCSVAEVEEVKLLISLTPVWLSCLPYGVIFAQGGTFFTKQGGTMNTRIWHDLQIPPASLLVFTGLAVVLTVPIYDKIFVPFARRITGFPSGISMLQRIGTGIFLAIMEVVVAALVESRRVKIAKEYELLDQTSTKVPMSVWWLLPQYLIAGISDVFALIGLQELFYDQMPKGMRSVGSATYLSILGVGSLLSSVVISIVQYVTLKRGEEWLVDNLNHAHLDYYYWLLAGICALGLALFIAVAKGFIYKKSLEGNFQR